MSDKADFDLTFEALTGNSPFPWQSRLYGQFATGHFPATACLPTGLGKTSIIAIWLIALANYPERVPRRFVYVVNRRTVVDQTTDEVIKYRKHLSAKPELAATKKALEELCAIPLQVNGSPLAISTLRGQFADNREWSTDPARPAVICGTVDMIGSRLLFSGYGIGFKSKPLHAGFLGQDVLLVHDEAHLEQPFQKLLKSIEEEQKQAEQTCHLPWKKLQVMELTATPRSENDATTEPPFKLDSDDERNDVIQQRLFAKKQLSLIPLTDAKKPWSELAEQALKFEASGQAVLVFSQNIETVMEVRDTLEKRKLACKTLTGTMRGLERDGLVRDSVFIRFLPESNRPPSILPAEGTVYLICTSAGEVGVNISADHLVCDLSPFDSMAQRFGRVNRFGNTSDTTVTVLYPTQFDPTKPLDPRREKTLALLQKLDGDASPQALGGLDPEERIAAFTPPPVMLPATDILFDAWALTSITGSLPGRPPVEPYLHGIAGWEPPETEVAWREEVETVTDNDLLERYPPGELLECFPILPHELLKDRSDRVFNTFLRKLELSDEQAKLPVWIEAPDGTIDHDWTIRKLVDAEKSVIEGKRLLLPPALGGLNSQGMLDANEVRSQKDDVEEDPNADFLDVSCQVSVGPSLRTRVWSDDPDLQSKTDGLHLIHEIDTRSDGEIESDELSPDKLWLWYRANQEGELTTTSKRPVLWTVHVQDVVDKAVELTTEGRLSLTSELGKAIVLAARFHDHGKRRRRFQSVLSNRAYPNVVLAKSDGKRSLVPDEYRHEFGSLIDLTDPTESDKAQFAEDLAEFANLVPEMRDVVLHLIATHHGWGRPHFDPDHGGYELERPGTDPMLADVPRRFARLQRRYGRWGLAYLESLLRAADWAASGNPSKYVGDDE
jgi:CRISPR-associated endonuclease/helicase Cas3